MLSCREFVEFMDDYLEGSLPKAVQDRFQSHLDACPACVTYERTYESTIRAARKALDSDPCEPVPEDLIRAILAAQTPSP